MKKYQIILVVVISAFVAGLLLNSWISTLMVWILSATVLVYSVYNFFIKKNKNIFFHPLFALMALIFVIKFLYFLFSEEKFATIESSLPLLIFPAMFLLLPTEKQVFEYVCKISVLTYLFIALAFIGSFLFWFFTNDVNFNDFIYNKKNLYPNYLIYPFFEHPTFFSLNLCFIFPLVLVAFNAMKMSKRLSLTLIILISAVVIFAIWLSGSRSGFLVSGVIAATLLLSRFKFNMIYKFGILPVFAIVLYLSASVWGINTQDNVRKEMLEQAKSYIEEKPFFGHGVGRLEYSVEAQQDNPEDYPPTFYHPHNQFYAELVRQGFIGALPLFLFIIAVFVATFYKNFNRLLFFWLLIHIPLMWIDTPLDYYGSISLSFWICFFITNKKNSPDTTINGYLGTKFSRTCRDRNGF